MRLYQNQPSGTVARARQLRRQATEAEKRLLRALKEGLPRYKWRFQVPAGPYYADILSFGAKLIFELDGGQHSEAATYDARRTRFLEEQGFRVLRFWNNDVMENVEGVIASIASSLSLWEREGAHRVSGGKGEGDRTSPLTSRSPSPSHSAAPSGPLPLPMGEGQVGEER